MKILATAYISKNGLFYNNDSISLFKEENWLKECYQLLSIDYPKFHKMDNLSKMAFLTSETLKENGHFDGIADNAIELIFANRNASQLTDMRFIDSYKNHKNPSPSLFVYTLPNILTGELAIRNKWFGENSFFVTPKFNPQLFAERMFHAAKNGKKICLCGWVDTHVNENNVPVMEESFLFLVSLNSTCNQEDQNNLSKELSELYQRFA